MFEIVYDGRRRRTDGRRLDGYTISSPCEPNGSGELKTDKDGQESGPSSVGGSQKRAPEEVEKEPKKMKSVSTVFIIDILVVLVPCELLGPKCENGTC